MDRLELKHLAPYLSYGLTIHNIIDGTIMEMSIHSDLYPYKQKTKLNGIIPLMVVINSNTAKPILRPMSDLEGDSEYIDMLQEMHTLEYNEDIGFSDECTSGFGPEWLPYAVMEKLFEYHFDVFGLIPAGLAIDINTLQEGAKP